MARSRNIKPGFFRNADLAELPFEARLLFIGLWTIADRQGRLEDRPKQIKMEVFPADNLDCDTLLQSLAGTGMLIRYEVNGKRYLQIANFSKHQNPHKDERESIIPPPDQHDASTIAASGLHGASAMQAPCKHDASTVGIRLIPDSLLLIPDSKDSCSPSASDTSANGFDEFWEAYPRKDAKLKAKEAWKKLRASPETLVALMAGLDRAKRSEGWQGDNRKFIPYPATWLNGRRWEDDSSDSLTTAGSLPEFMQGAI